MILEGDILEYFDEIGVDVEVSSYEDSMSFLFQISYHDFELDATFTIERNAKFQLEISNKVVILSPIQIP